MLPVFPNFKPLEITDKSEISALTKIHKPYSDFGFTSIFSWDTRQDIEISSLNKNLVLKFSDYINGSKFFTFIGDNAVDETIEKLLDYAGRHGLTPELKLMPETVVNLIKDKARFSILEDRDNFDYILSVEDQITLPGKDHAKRRYVLNKFHTTYGDNLRISKLNLSDRAVQAQVIDMFERWEKSMGKERSETESELVAIKRLMDHVEELDVQLLGVFINDSLAGFSIYEIVQDNYGVIHFEKADVTFKGIFQYLKHAAAKELYANKQVYINIEQDLGIAGLRESKSSHHPVHFLKKYTVRLAKD